MAINQLQRVLLGSQLVYDEADHGNVEEIFNSVIFPLVDELLKPHVYQLDPSGMSETRLRASALLCKVFIHFEVGDNRGKPDVRVLWIEILDLLDRIIAAERSEQLVSKHARIPLSLVLILIYTVRGGLRITQKRCPGDERRWDSCAAFTRRRP